FLLLILLSTASLTNVLGVERSVGQKARVLLNGNMFEINQNTSYVWEDSTNKLTIAQIVTPYWQQRIPLIHIPVNSNQNKQSTYWRKVVLKNQSNFKT